MSDVQTVQGWSNVDRSHPCEICGTITNYCSYTENVVVCRVQAGDGAVQRQDKTGGLMWLHFKKGTNASDQPKQALETIGPKYQYERADADTLDRVYRHLLGALILEPGDRLELQKRGYANSEIEAIGFKSWPASRELVREAMASLVATFGETLLTVPGFSKDQVKSTIKVVELGGYLLPIRDAEKRIIGLQARRDEAPKYLPFSSTSALSCGGGLLVHVPDVAEPSSADHVVITEGIHKAEMVARRLGATAIGLPSVTAMALGLPAIEASGKPAVVLALDADARTKPQVGAALIHGANIYAEHGYEVRLATWTLDAGKGLDDVIHAGKLSEVKFLAGKDAWNAIVDMARAARVEIPKPVAARLKLLGVVERAAADSAVALRAETIDAITDLNEGSVECQRLLTDLVNAAGKIKTSLHNKIKEARKAKAKQRRIENAQARGSRVLDRGDHTELASVISEELTTVYQKWDSSRQTRVELAIKPLYAEGAYWRYDCEKGIWAEIAEDAIDRKTLAMAGTMLSNGRALHVNGSTLRGVRDALESLLAQPGFFAKAVPGIAFRNGFATVSKTGIEVEGHNANNRARFAYPFDYLQSARPELFLRLLNRYFRHHADRAERIALIQEFSGAVRIGQATKAGKVLVLYGQAGNDGKSTLGKILRESMPTGSTCELKPQQFGDKFRLARLAGKLLNVVDDLPRRRIEASEDFKTAVTAKNPQCCEQKGKDPFDVLFMAGHLLAGNYLPTSEDWSGGWVRRFVVIEFDDPITPDEDRKDVESEVLADLQSLVCWSLDGAVRFLNNGMAYTVPKSSDVIIEQWKLDADPVKAWVASRTSEVAETRLLTSGEDLYADYREYADKHGHGKMSVAEFSNRLRPYRKHTKLGNRYRLALKPDPSIMATDTVEQQREFDALVRDRGAVVAVSMQHGRPTLTVQAGLKTYQWPCAMEGLSNIGIGFEGQPDDGFYPLDKPVDVAIEVADGDLARLHALN